MHATAVVECSNISVPLDWASPLAHSNISFYVQRIRQPVAPPNALFIIFGGPGEVLGLLPLSVTRLTILFLFFSLPAPLPLPLLAAGYAAFHNLPSHTLQSS